MTESAAYSDQHATESIFLVDDSQEELLFVKRICDSVGLSVVTHNSADEFLQSDCPSQAGVVLIDMLMPAMDGLALFAELQRRNSPLVCVLMSSFGDTASCRAAFRAGIFDFIEKDASPKEFYDIIQRGLEVSRQESSGSDAAQRAGTS